MSALTPPNYCRPIPNGPFYSPPSWQICGNYLNYTVGYGICISPEGDMETWNCGVGVNSLVAGYGIQVTPLTPDVFEVSNSGLIAILPGEGINTTGGPNPTLSLSDSGVNPGLYSYPTISVDEHGRITGAAVRARTIRCDTIQAKGNLIVGQEASVPTALPVGSNGRYLTPDSSCALGVRWALPNEFPYVLCCCLPSKGYLVIGSSTPNTPVALSPGTGSRVLISCASCPNGIYWGNCAFASDPQNYTGTSSQTSCSMVTCLVTPTFSASGCSAYRIMLTGTACSVDSGEGIGFVNLEIGGVPTSAFTCFTTRISLLGVEEPVPFSLVWIHFNPTFNTNLPLALNICANQRSSGAPPITMATCYNVSIFGF